MKIFINTPYVNGIGGVSNHYLGLRNYWTEEVVYSSIGSRHWRAILFPFRAIKFVIRLLLFRPDVVLLNPSIGKRALKRDFMYLRIARSLGFKVAVFIHGFNKSVVPELDRKWLQKNLNECACIFVLAKEFKQIVESWGVSSPVYLTTTKVDDELIRHFNVEKRTGEVRNILFLARVTREKGIFIALEAFQILQKRMNNALSLTVVGDGEALGDSKAYVKKMKLEGVIFTGSLSGQQLIEQYKKGDIYLFPSFHEGMPTSVLEAMAFGLLIITRPVGGLVDFFEQKTMGEMVDSMDANDFAEAIVPFIGDKENVRRISFCNAKYAQAHFMASNVAKQIEKVLDNAVVDK